MRWFLGLGWVAGCTSPVTEALSTGSATMVARGNTLFSVNDALEAYLHTL